MRLLIGLAVVSMASIMRPSWGLYAFAAGLLALCLRLWFSTQRKSPTTFELAHRSTLIWLVISTIASLTIWLVLRVNFSSVELPGTVVPAMVKTPFQAQVRFDDQAQRWELDQLVEIEPDRIVEISRRQADFLAVRDSNDSLLLTLPQVTEKLARTGWRRIAITPDGDLYRRQEYRFSPSGSLQVSKLDTIVFLLPTFIEESIVVVPEEGSTVEVETPGGMLLGSYPPAIQVDTMISSGAVRSTIPLNTSSYGSAQRIELSYAGRLFRSRLLRWVAEASLWDVLGWLWALITFVWAWLIADWLKARLGPKATKLLSRTPVGPKV